MVNTHFTAQEESSAKHANPFNLKPSEPWSLDNLVFLESHFAKSKITTAVKMAKYSYFCHSEILSAELKWVSCGQGHESH